MDGVNTYNCRCPPEWTGMYVGYAWDSLLLTKLHTTMVERSELCSILEKPRLQDPGWPQRLVTWGSSVLPLRGGTAQHQLVLVGC